MTGIPAWQAPTAGYSAYAGHVNQLLGAHAVQYLYAGTLQAGSTAFSGSDGQSNVGWYAQKFTAGAAQAHVGYVQMYMPGTAGSPPPWEISIMADSGGAPSGTALVTTALPKELAAPAGWVTIPLPTGVTASAAYWVVAPFTSSSSSDYFEWSLNGSSSGASTSGNGTTWTAAAYGLSLQVFDQSATGLLTATWEDSGARWTRLSYDSGGQVTGYGEYTAGQTANGYTASNRTLTYSGALLTGVA